MKKETASYQNILEKDRHDHTILMIIINNAQQYSIMLYSCKKFLIMKGNKLGAM